MQQYFKILQSIGLLGSILILCACPSRENQNCEDEGSQARVNDLIVLSPLKTTYQQGEIINFSISIPSNNSYFQTTSDLYLKTADSESNLTTNSKIFEGNALEFVVGSQGQYNNWFVMPYNSNTKTYDLIIKIKLNKLGTYSILTGADYVDFQGAVYCNRFRINTNILGEKNGKIEFVVQ